MFLEEFFGSVLHGGCSCRVLCHGSLTATCYCCCSIIIITHHCDDYLLLPVVPLHYLSLA